MPKNKNRPSKIKVRKHLNADAMFGAIRNEFEKIPEFRVVPNKAMQVWKYGHVLLYKHLIFATCCQKL